MNPAIYLALKWLLGAVDKITNFEKLRNFQKY